MKKTLVPAALVGLGAAVLMYVLNSALPLEWHAFSILSVIVVLWIGLACLATELTVLGVFRVSLGLTWGYWLPVGLMKTLQTGDTSTTFVIGIAVLPLVAFFSVLPLSLLRLCPQQVRRKVVLPALVLVGGTGLWLWFRDEPPPADGDLRLARRQVASDENGFFLINWRQIECCDPDLQLSFTPSDPDYDPRKAHEYVRQHERSLEILKRALELPEFQLPARSAFDHSETEMWRHLVSVLETRARLRVEAHESHGAFEDAWTLLKFGARIEGGQGGAISYLVGLAIQSIGGETLHHCLEETDLPATDLESLVTPLASLRSRDAGDEAFREMTLAEYATLDGLLDDTLNGNSGWLDLDLRLTQAWSWLLPLVLKRNQTLRVAGDYYRVILAQGARGALRPEDIACGTTCGDVDLETIPVTNWLGRLALRHLLPTQQSIVVEKARMDATYRGLQTIIAIRRFETDRGETPQTLDELVPAFLEAVPRDPFGGALLRYSPLKRRVWSLGENLSDDGGAEKDDVDAMSEVDDPTFHLFPAPG